MSVVTDKRDPDSFAAQFKDALKRCIQDPLYLGQCMGYKGTPEGRKKFGRLHYEMLAHMESQPKTSTVCSRGHAKTTIGIIKNCHTKITDPSSRILVGSSTLDLGKKILGETRDRLGGDIELLPGFYMPLAELFPWAAPKYYSGRVSAPCETFNVMGRTGQGREPCFMTASPTMNLAGNHPTHATIDDPANEQNSKTQMRRDQVISFMEQLVPIMYDTSSPITHIGTPWAFSDVTSHLADAEDYSQFRFGVWDGWNPATGERDGKGPGPDGGWPLCPSYLTAEEIYQIQAENSKAFFSMQYECRPVAGEDALFEQEMFDAATNYDISPLALPQGYDILLLDPVAKTEGMARDVNGVIVLRVCTAATLGIGADKLEPDHNIFIPHYAAEVRGNIDSALCHIEHLVQTERFPDLRSIWVENVAFSGLIKPWLKERGRIHGIQVRTQKIPTKNLELRLKGFPTAMRQRIIQFPPAFEGRDRLLKRLLEFPMSDSDDLPAALVLLASHLERRGQLPFNNVERVHGDWARDGGVGLPPAIDEMDWA